MNEESNKRAYVILSPVHNGAETLERTIRSVVAQTERPQCYMIVSDGSTDGTDEIARRYADEHDWIRFLRREKPAADKLQVERAAPGKAGAFKVGMEAMADLAYAYIACLDDDVDLPPDYYRTVIDEFLKDPELGICGGGVRNILPDGAVAPGGFFKPDFVGGPVQMFRRTCYEDTGGFRPYGFADCVIHGIAVRKGWNVRTLPDLVVDHHVPERGYAPTIRSKVPTCYYLGGMHYVMREPLWREFLRCGRRAFQRPWLLGGVAMLTGYLGAWITKRPKIPLE